MEYDVEKLWDQLSRTISFLKEKWRTGRLKLIGFVFVLLAVFFGDYVIQYAFFAPPNHNQPDQNNSSLEEPKREQTEPDHSRSSGEQASALTSSKPSTSKRDRVARELETKQLLRKLNYALDRAKHSALTEKTTALRLFSEVVSELSEGARRDLDSNLLSNAQRADHEGVSEQAIEYYKALFNPYASNGLGAYEQPGR